MYETMEKYAKYMGILIKNCKLFYRFVEVFMV